jgi:TPR repeat protein
MAESLVETLVPRTPFSSPEELVDFVVENRRASVQKLAQQLRLSTFEVRRLMSTSDFRKRSSEALSLRVLSLEQEQRILEKIADDAMSEETKPGDRVRSAEFLLRQAGVERARETKVDVDHSVRVVFDAPRLAESYWKPPDPLNGVVGAAALPSPNAGALPLPVEGLVAEPLEEAFDVEFAPIRRDEANS